MKSLQKLIIGIIAVKKIKSSRCFFKAKYITGQPEAKDEIQELKWFVLKSIREENIVTSDRGLFRK